MLTVRTRVIVAVGRRAPNAGLATWSGYNSYEKVWLHTFVEEPQSTFRVHLSGASNDSGAVVGLHARFDSVERILLSGRSVFSSSHSAMWCAYRSQYAGYAGHWCSEPNRILFQHLRSRICSCWMRRRLLHPIARRARAVVFAGHGGLKIEVLRPAKQDSDLEGQGLERDREGVL